ncbi:hypothetical protein MRB53_038866 [Persea americana]|nr:hypothetical protein MRB53_038866 [Persea americana]
MILVGKNNRFSTYTSPIRAYWIRNCNEMYGCALDFAGPLAMLQDILRVVLGLMVVECVTISRNLQEVSSISWLIASFDTLQKNREWTFISLVALVGQAVLSVSDHSLRIPVYSFGLRNHLVTLRFPTYELTYLDDSSRIFTLVSGPASVLLLTVAFVSILAGARAATNSDNQKSTSSIVWCFRNWSAELRRRICHYRWNTCFVGA